MTTPNPQQALEADIDEDEEEIDYDALYGGLEIGVKPEISEEIKHDISEVAKDVATQFAKETLIGAGGTYGDLFELMGVEKDLPGAKEKKKAETSVMKKMQQPGYTPTLSDVVMLGGDDDILPEFPGSPTSEDLRELNEAMGGPGEAKTPYGKGAARAGKLYGSGLAFGQINPLPAVVGGTSGQLVEEAGGGPLLQAAAEIISMILTPQGGLKTLVSSQKKDIQKKIDALRKLGYTEEDITLAINSQYANSKRQAAASKGSKTQQAFENFSENSDEIVRDILRKEIPGIEKGTKNVHEMASDFYRAVAQEGRNLTISNPMPFLNSSKKVVDHLTNTLGNNPKAIPFITRLSEAAIDSIRYPSAEKMMNFYKELNSMGEWLGRSERDRLITEVKNGIKDTFKSEGKNGREFAKKFEKANEGVQKAYKAEELHNLIEKVTTQDGIDYKRFKKLFDNKENVELFHEVLGPQQAKNMNMIAKVGSEVKDFDKSWKAANSFKLELTGDAARSGLGFYYLYKGDYDSFAAVAATKLGSAAVRKIMEKSLTDPKYQNLVIKGLHAVKTESPKLMKSAEEAMKKYLMEEGIDLDEIE